MPSPLLWDDSFTPENPKPPEPPPNVVSVDVTLMRTTTIETVLQRRKRESS